jgi:uracil phosphoribosyltransferase
MNIAIGSDHAGYELKDSVMKYLRELGHLTLGFGAESAESYDYPDAAFLVADAVASGNAQRGICICGTGIGMAIAANKVSGIYATPCYEERTASLSRRHNNTNVLTLGARITPSETALRIVKTWIETDFEGDRHERRIQKIRRRENRSELPEDVCGKVTICDHPLVQHKVSIIRNRDTSVKEFRELVQEIAGLMVYEVTRDLPLTEIEVETPLEKTRAFTLEGKKLAIVPILRAGLGMVEGILRLVPNAVVGHIGLYRDPSTLQPVEYYCKLPGDIAERDIFILDPMLATGGSAAAALSLVKSKRGKRISLVSIIAAPEGITKVHSEHPDVDIYAAALDRHLNDHGYIIPGLGDAGDRLFGTK